MTESKLSVRRGWPGPVSGLLFFGAVLGSAAVFGGFDFFGGVEVEPSFSPETLLAEVQAKEGAILTSSVIMLIGLGFLGLYLSDLKVRSSGSGLGWPSQAFVVGGVMIGAAWLINLMLQMAADLAAEEGHVESLVTFIDLLWVALWLFLPGLLTVGAAAAVVGLGSEFHPKWLGVIGVGVALSALLPWYGLFVFVVWVAADSVRRLVKKPFA